MTSCCPGGTQQQAPSGGGLANPSNDGGLEEFRLLLPARASNSAILAFAGSNCAFVSAG